MWGSGPSVYGQSNPDSDAATYPTDTDVNLFATVDGRDVADGLSLTLPPGWNLHDVVVLRYGADRLPVTVQPDAALDGAYRVDGEDALRGPLEIIIQARTAAASQRGRWSLVPFTDADADAPQPHEQRRTTRTVETQTPADEADGAPALRLSDADAPLLLHREALPAIGPEENFTIEFWMQTTGLDEVVLSLWDGHEASAYPVELTTDASGRLRHFHGRPGEHRTLRSRGRVADGRWRHVALTHAADEAQLVLLLDGQPVDSLRGTRLAENAASSVGVGGRLPGADDADPGRPYSGALSTLRIWPDARSAGAIRETMRRTVEQTSERGPATLATDLSLPDELVAEAPPAIDLAPSRLTFHAPLDNLRAALEDDGVHLQWATAPDDVHAFVVERSSDGQQFTPAGRLDPAEVLEERDGQAYYQFIDGDADAQVLYYRIRQAFADGTERVSSTIKIGLGRNDAAAHDDDGDAVTLLGNFPNPFTSTTTITYEVHEPTDVQVTVWDLTGTQVRHITDEPHAPGSYEHTFSAEDLPSGTYFIRLQTPEGVTSQQMTLLQ